MKLKQLANYEQGFSLMEVLMAVAVMSIISFVMAQMFNSQLVGQKYLSQKYELLDVKNFIMSSFANADICSCQLNVDSADNPHSSAERSQIHFDRSLTSDKKSAHPDQVINVNKIFGGCGAAAPTLVAAGQKVPGSQTNLYIKSVSLVDLVPTGITDEWNANWRIDFDGGGVSLAPIKIAQKISIDSTSPENSTKISFCQSQSSVISQNSKSFTATDFHNMTPSILVDDALEKSRIYSIPVATQSFNQYLTMSAIGIWDVSKCGYISTNACTSKTSIQVSINSTLFICSSNSSTGSSGPYTNLVSNSSSCTFEVPAGKTAIIKILFDGRNGQYPNYDPSTYSGSSGTANSIVFTIYSIH